MEEEMYEALKYAYEILLDQAEKGLYPELAMKVNGGKGFRPINEAIRQYEKDSFINRHDSYLHENADIIADHGLERFKVVVQLFKKKEDMRRCLVTWESYAHDPFLFSHFPNALEHWKYQDTVEKLPNYFQDNFLN